jgi:hypothetical protein
MREIKAWSEYLAGHLGVGGQATRGGRRRREKAATVGRSVREEDETNSSAPLGRETRGEAASLEGANQKEKRIP